MLDQELLRLAEMGGAAVVAAAATDGWTAVRERVASWFGRGGDPPPELARLDQVRGVLRSGDSVAADRIRAAETDAWRELFERRLASLEGQERGAVVDGLRRLVAECGRAGGGLSNAQTSGPASPAVGRDFFGQLTINVGPQPPDRNEG